MSNNVFRTTKCSAYEHPEFTLVFDTSVPQADIEVLASFLEDSVAEGTRYKDGDLITVGSMLFRVAMIKDALSIEEPNLLSLPIEWTQGVSRTMQLLRLQKDIAESLGLEDEIDPPSIRCSLLVGANLTLQDKELVLDRVNASVCDSGWFVGRQDSELNYEDKATLKRISVYQAILNWPQIGGFLALPVGCRVEFSRQKPRFTRNGRDLEIKSGSLIDALAKGSLMNEPL